MMSRLQIRTKIALVMTCLLGVISIAVYLYVPAALHRQIVQSVIQKSAALSTTTAFSVGEALHARNRASVAAALAGLRGNPDLVYLVLTDDRGRPFASFNELVAAESRYLEVPMERIATPQRPVQGGQGSGRFSGPEVMGGITADGMTYQTVVPVRHEGRLVGRLYTGMSLHMANADAARTRAAIAVVTILVFAVGTVLLFALSTLITVPLKRIVQTTQAIAAGDFSRRAEVGSRDEVGDLATAFNEMVDRVAAAYEQLADWNRRLETRVQERTAELTLSEERYRLLFERNLAAVYIADENGKVIDCNEACATLFRYPSREEFLREGRIEYMHPHRREGVIRRLRDEGTVANEEVELRGRNDTPVWVLENVRRVAASGTGEALLEGILLDITDRKRAAEEIAHRAYHDALTGLPNRALLLDRLEVAMAQSRRIGETLAILFLDLDNMKAINDTFGHETGDRVLTAVASRLSKSVRASDTVARVGGDEFLILLTVKDSSEAESVARKLLHTLSEPLVVERDELYVTSSIGVALHPAEGDSAAILIRRADEAMYRVKEAGGNSVQLSTRQARHSVGRLSIEDQLRGAIERDEFVLHYQPQVHIEDRILSGAEALVRWQRPDGTLVSPSGFMTIAEQSGLITALGEIVLTKACEQMAAWQREGSAPPRLGVNVSARQFHQRDFVGLIERTLSQTGLSAQRLELEITETVAVQTSERSIEMLQHLRSLGVSVAVDDFGTGQSSISYLKRFPVDTVKIDRTFVQDLVNGENDEWIITAVLMLANHLGLRTVAEGVETEQQSAFLRTHDCREIQGYLISEGLPADDFAERFLGRRDAGFVSRVRST